MDPVRCTNRVNSVLASFEKTISENHAAGGDSSMYLNNILASSKARKPSRRDVMTKTTSSRRIAKLPEIDENAGANFCIDTITTTDSTTAAFDPFASDDDSSELNDSVSFNCSNSDFGIDDFDSSDDFDEINWEEQGSVRSGGSRTSMVSHRSSEARARDRVEYSYKRHVRKKRDCLGSSTHSHKSKSGELGGSSHHRGKKSGHDLEGSCHSISGRPPRCQEKSSRRKVERKKSSDELKSSRHRHRDGREGSAKSSSRSDDELKSSRHKSHDGSRNRRTQGPATSRRLTSSSVARHRESS